MSRGQLVLGHVLMHAREDNGVASEELFLDRDHNVLSTAARSDLDVDIVLLIDRDRIKAALLLPGTTQ